MTTPVPLRTSDGKADRNRAHDAIKNELEKAGESPEKSDAMAKKIFEQIDKNFDSIFGKR